MERIDRRIPVRAGTAWRLHESVSLTLPSRPLRGSLVQPSLRTVFQTFPRGQVLSSCASIHGPGTDLEDLMNDSGSRPVDQPVTRWALVLSRLRKPVIAVAAIGTVLGGLAGYVTLYRTVASTPPSASDTAAQGLPVTDAISILVLPLANQTGDPAKAYVADALTTAITSDLSRIQDAVIVPPVTAAALQEKKLTLQQLGTEARVRFVLQGGASLSGERLRVNVQLSDTRSGHQLWSQAFEAPMGDLFALQDDLTLRIRTSVGPQMVLVAAREAQAREKNPQVADLILRLRALDLQQ